MNIKELTTTKAKRYGIKSFNEGKTFADANVYPKNFVLDCVKANRTDLVNAWAAGWHLANIKAPVK